MVKHISKRPRPLTERQKEQIRIARQGPSESDMAKTLKSKAECDLVRDDLNAVMADLKQFRESAGMSLTDLQDLTGISKGALSRLENGLGNPTLATVQRIAKTLGVDITIHVSSPVK